MNRVLKNYCTECEWSASNSEYTVHERSQLAVDHAVTTGHDIDCVLESEVSPDDSSPWVIRDTR